MDNNQFNITEEKANQFNFTLNKVIMMSSKEYFR